MRNSSRRHSDKRSAASLSRSRGESPYPYPCRRKHRLQRRHGLTLIEMLIAVTITLMVMAAIVQVFDLLGDNLRNGRAVIDITTELRLIAHRLQQDLDGLTCPVRPSIAPESGLGYFEYGEGRGSDGNWNANAVADFVDANSDGQSDEDATYGDVDDYLAFTTRSSGQPFVGRVPVWNEFLGQADTGQAESAVAEVCWWTAAVDLAEDGLDPDDDGIPDISDSVMLFRCPLLVLPGWDLSPSQPSSGDTFLGLDNVNTFDDVLDFLESYNISVKWVDSDADGLRDMLLPNSLGDLTQRENRFLHFMPQPATAGGLVAPDATTFPYLMSEFYIGTPSAQAEPWGSREFGLMLPVMQSNGIGLGPRLRFSRFVHSSTRGVAPAAINPPTPPVAQVPPDPQKYQLDLASFGIGVRAFAPLMADSSMVDNILSFDVRCYDPTASLNVGTTMALAPGDPGYEVPTTPHALGAYVDLNYAPNLNVSTFSRPYAMRPQVPAFPALFYDTWSSKYERDGIDQDGDGLFDEGTNGIDDPDGFAGPNSANAEFTKGIDNAWEMEAPPPHPAPLRGIEVRIRKMDFETRRIRQVSVVGDFVPE